MIYTDIGRNRMYAGRIAASSGECGPSGAAVNLLGEEGAWCTRKHNAITADHAVIDYGEVLPVNFIEMRPSQSGLEVFPESFRFEASQDGETWKVLHTEKSFDITQFDRFTLALPITFLQYLKVMVLRQRNVNKKFYAEIGSVAAGIKGFTSIVATSSSSYQHDISQILNGKPGSYWESEPGTEESQERIEIDLGNIFHVNRITLVAPPMEDHGFPSIFTVELSTDLVIWSSVLTENGFSAEASGKYFWEIASTPARFMRINITTKKLEGGTFAARIASLEIAAAHVNPFHTHNIGEITPYASVFSAGIVRLAKDGEDAIGTAVQGNDHRLRDASTIYKGITRLANYGEVGEGLAVQASDPRIQPATDVREGIVRFAYDREGKAGTAVQGNDSRLQEASISNYGIVKLCPDNVYSENSVVQGNDSRLRKATVSEFGICRLADNGENLQGCVVQGNDRRLRDATTLYRGIVELGEDGEDREGVVVQGNDRRLRDATTASRGIVELAEDGEDAPGVAVQGNDRRLKDATESSKGIMRFARDGEATSFAAVQAGDRRLRDATTSYRGIVELAEDGEDVPGVAVQGNDRRLKEASTSTRGIVELAEDGEDRPGVAVQGNDRRLREAGEENHGIMRFARDGEPSPRAAVQGSDRRLREATTTSPGIVELGEDGEDREGVAVQGNDRRLREATTTSPGIVELGEDGEDREGVVVQGNDRRLKHAGEMNFGIVRLAKDGEKREGLAVQSHDARLFDAREPLPHNHEYAPLHHDYGAHSGIVKVIAQRQGAFGGILPPPDDSSIIYGRNESKESGAVGVTGIASSFSDDKKRHQYGVLGHSQFVGVRGQSAGNEEGDDRGCGVLGLSRFGAGGVFSSEHAFSLVADGFGRIDAYDSTPALRGNGDALLVNGHSEFHGRVNIYNRGEHPAGIVELFEVDDEEYVTPGDVLVASPRGGGILSRSRSPYDRGVVGIVSGNPTMIFNNAGEGKRLYPVVLSGRALCRIDAREKAVKPGDLIVTSSMPGCGMAGDVDSPDKTGTVVAKALDSLAEGVQAISVFIFHA